MVEDIHGTSLPFSNADYIFKDQNIIGELKRLVENKNNDEDIQSKIQAKFDLWMQDGTVGPMYGSSVVDSKTLPEKCQRELIDIFKHALQRRLLKANKQIRETAEAFGMPDAKGLVFLVNDGNFALEADAVIYLIGRILGHDCTSINSVVYFTVNMIASGPMTEKQVLIWAHANRKRILEPVDSDFVTRVFNSWCEYLGQLRNESIEIIDIDRPDLDQIRYDQQN